MIRSSLTRYAISLISCSAVLCPALTGKCVLNADSDDHHAGLAVYREIALLMKKADELKGRGKSDEALTMYRDLIEKLLFFQKNNPSWNNALTKQDIELCRRRIEELEGPPGSSPHPSVYRTVSPPQTGPRPAGATDSGMTTDSDADTMGGHPIHPVEPESLLDRARALASQGRDQESLRMLDGLVSERPEFIEAYRA
jgi:hypothetical protein